MDERPKHANGTNVIVINEAKEILVVKANYGSKQWMLPGGEIKRDETPRRAAERETMEETGIEIDEKKLSLISILVQRSPDGMLFLYATKHFKGDIALISPQEISEARFVSVQEFIGWESQVGLAYRRMLIRFLRSVHKLDSVPSEARLADRVEYPKGLDIEFEGILLQI